MSTSISLQHPAANVSDANFLWVFFYFTYYILHLSIPLWDFRYKTHLYHLLSCIWPKCGIGWTHISMWKDLQYTFTQARRIHFRSGGAKKVHVYGPIPNHALHPTSTHSPSVTEWTPTHEAPSCQMEGVDTAASFGTNSPLSGRNRKCCNCINGIKSASLWQKM